MAPVGVPQRRSTAQLPQEQVRHQYSAVYVLMISWEHDDLGVAKEIDELQGVFEMWYGFSVNRFLIPDERPDDALNGCLSQFVQEHRSPKNLLIVYYGGHGSLNDSKLAEWQCHSRLNSPTVKWYSHQPLLENSPADALLIIDSCRPVGGGGSVLKDTRKWVLASCGFQSEAPGVGENSFSRALIDELMDDRSRYHSFSCSQLNHRLTKRLRTWVSRAGEQRQQPVLDILGEGGEGDASIWLASYIVWPLNLIAVMGTTGSGKSSLVNHICGREVASVGRGQESKTVDVVAYSTVVNEKTVTLLDTPGFDDTYHSDTDILKKISTYLFDHFQRGCMVTGILYLRDINLDRMTGSAMKNLDMFRRLCGTDALKNVVLLTTKWDKAPDSASSHEQELIDNFWKGMIEAGSLVPKRTGSRVEKSRNIVDPRTDVISPMLEYVPTWMQIQREGGEMQSLVDSESGRYLKDRLDHVLTDHYKRANQQSREELAEIEKIKRESQALQERWEATVQAEAVRRSKASSSVSTGEETAKTIAKGAVLLAAGYGAYKLITSMMSSDDDQKDEEKTKEQKQ